MKKQLLLVRINKKSNRNKRELFGGIMNYKDLLLTIRDEFPESIDDFIESFQILNAVIYDIYVLNGDKINELYIKKELEKVDCYLNVAKEIDIYKEKTDEVINLLKAGKLNDCNENNIVYNQEKPHEIVECTLATDFTFRKPYGFLLDNKDIIIVDSWKTFLVRICEVLIKLDEEKFLSFENNINMNGTNRKYFSTSKEGMRSAELVKDLIYVETNQNANSIRDLVKKALYEYGYKTRDMKVYLKK